MSTIFLSAHAVPTRTKTQSQRIGSILHMGGFLQQTGFMRRNRWFGVVVLLGLLGTGAPDVEAKGSVRITFNTIPTAPLATYTPNNVVALWIQNAAGQHVRTVGIWSAVRTQHLISYVAASGTAIESLPPDAVSGASRVNHADALTALWNLKDKNNTVVPDGTYTIRVEFAEGNATAAN